MQDFSGFVLDISIHFTAIFRTDNTTLLTVDNWTVLLNETIYIVQDIYSNKVKTNVQRHTKMLYSYYKLKKQFYKRQSFIIS